MNRAGSVGRAVVTAATVTALAGGAAAQGPVRADEPLPPGHPRLAAPAASASAVPAGHPPVAGTAAASASALPAGHPPVAGTAADGAAADGPGETQENPHGEMTEPIPNRVAPAPDLPQGTVQVHVQDAASRPQPRVPVRLSVMRQNVATGDSRQEREGATDENGIATFRDLPTETSYSFQATVERGPAKYSAETFHLEETGGKRVLLHVYPVSRDLRDALLGMRGVVFVQPREDVFHVEMNFQVLNLGTVTWVPEGVRLDLPAGAKAFRANESTEDDTRAEQRNGSVVLLGTYSPGKHDVAFQFQLENTHDRSREIQIDLPPHMAEVRVVAEGARGMSLHVDGFPDPEPMQGQDGSRLLVTGRRATRGEPGLSQLAIQLDNIPIPSPGRWYAAFFAIVIAVGGLYQMASRRRSPERRVATKQETQQAEDLILEELVALEKLRREDGIGPRAYAEARGGLIDALARLEAGRGAPA